MSRIALPLAALLAVAGASSPDRSIALDAATQLVPGGFAAGHQPDGNSVIITGPKGAIVFDTGRHADHIAAIEAALATTGKPLVAIVNSHWHLDHVSGNLRLKADHPGASVWASGAIDGALTGFLARSAVQGQAALDQGQVPEPMASDVRGDLATIGQGQRLRPDHVVAGPMRLTVTGRPVDLRLAPHAVTAGDVWLYDRGARRAVVGDLVTLPVPFLDTACPSGWMAALDAVAASGFRTLVPGHGPVMDRAAFDRWRGAFTRFVQCGVDAGQPVSACVAGWMDDAATMIPADQHARASGMARYYAERLRSGELAANCTA